MKKLLTLLIAASLALFPVYLPAGDQAAYAPVSVPMQPVKLTDDVYYVEGLAGAATDHEGFISNAGFVITDEGVVLFDALGTPALAWQLRQEIAKITDKPVIKVVVSHYHADHILGLEVFKDEGAEVIAPAEASIYLDSGVGKERLEERSLSLDPWVTEKTRLVPPDVWLDRSMTLEIGGKTLSILHLGKAHSDGDMAMLVEPDKVLFTGDILFEGRVPFVGSADTAGWLEALESMQTSGLEALVPGHGPSAGDPDAAIVMTRDYLAYLREVMGAAVEEWVDFDVAYAEADWSRFENLPAFEEANRINAYAVYLSMTNETLD
ncbi:MAG: MBL fold metallo-hydrolase [Gammaproteobacteria bacterium]|jgi:glyoxylase-like metal-dependent hydrolase (beta-lactamase superfamily II)